MSLQDVSMTVGIVAVVINTLIKVVEFIKKYTKK